MPVADDFSKNYALWLDSSSPPERALLEQKLSRTFRRAWSSGKMAVRKQVLDFIYLTRTDGFEVVLKGLKDKDLEVARSALGVTALLVWKGYGSQLGDLRGQLESLATRDPQSAATCRSVLRRL
jgi:hypothetical protein